MRAVNSGNAPKNLFIVPHRGVVYNFNIATREEAVSSGYRKASGFLTKYKNEQRESIEWQTIINALIPHAIARWVTIRNIAAIIVRTLKLRTLWK